MGGALNYALMEKFKQEKIKQMSATPTSRVQSENIIDEKEISVDFSQEENKAKKLIFNTEISG